MRILVFCGGSYMGGMERVLYTLMCTLRERGHEVGAIVAGWNDGEYLELLKSSHIEALPVKLGRLTRHLPYLVDGLVHYPAAALRLAREARSFRPDVVVHVDVLTSLSALPCLPRRTLHVMHVHNAPGHDYRLALGRMALRRMDGFVCVSQFVRCRLEGLVANNVACVAHNGVEVPGSTRRSVPVSGTTRIGIVGQLQPSKRHSVLLHALALLDAPVRDRCEVAIVGRDNGAEAGRLRGLIRELSLGDMVRWTGHVREKAAIYQDMDVLAAPAIDEAFGLTVLEAAMHGIPAIAARSGSFPETVADGQTGILVEPDSPESLACALSQLIREPDVIGKLGDNARRHVSEHFNAAAFASRFEACVLALARRREGNAEAPIPCASP